MRLLDGEMVYLVLTMDVMEAVTPDSIWTTRAQAQDRVGVLQDAAPNDYHYWQALALNEVIDAPA